MQALIPIALFGWLPVVLVLFVLLPPRRAVIVAFLGAWLFLPVVRYTIPGVPDYSKFTATSFAVLLGILLFDPERLLKFRPRWPDSIVLVWCASRIATSLENGLGLYDGLSATFSTVVMWGLPYLIGRLYFTDLEGLRELAIGILIGGIIYVPLCLLEVRFSPQLHKWLYGFRQAPMVHAKRYGGFKPLVFMQSGLAVSMWMASATLIAVWLWSTGALRQIRGVPLGLIILALLITTILCKSVGAIMLLLVGVGVLFVVRYLRSPWPILLLVIAVPAYVTVRVTQTVSTGTIMAPVERIFDEKRAKSLRTRLSNEDRLSQKALKRPAFGWGGWGRSRVRDERGRDISITDGLWIITLGQRGLVGLGSLLALLLVPAWLIWRRVPTTPPWRARAAPAQILALITVLYAIDCLFNAMINPIFILALGGLSSVACMLKDQQRVARAQAPAGRAHFVQRGRGAIYGTRAVPRS